MGADAPKPPIWVISEDMGTSFSLCGAKLGGAW